VVIKVPTYEIDLTPYLEALSTCRGEHSRSTQFYHDLAAQLENEVVLGRSQDPDRVLLNFGLLGNVSTPYYSFGHGSVDTFNLIGIDELIIFAFYIRNQTRYRAVADIGANVGLHTVVMSRCGWEVTSFEPDPLHLQLMSVHLADNSVNQDRVVASAVSATTGVREFVRVLGNTTGSHLKGAKDSAYGLLEEIAVNVIPIGEVMKTADLIKMDVEGEEANIIVATGVGDWQDTDMILEVGSDRNALLIFEHLSSIGVNSFAQKTGWNRVSNVSDVPVTYREGSLFISLRETMPW